MKKPFNKLKQKLRIYYNQKLRANCLITAAHQLLIIDAGI